MKKKLTAKPRLAVERETVRHLLETQLSRVVGGSREVERTTTSSFPTADVRVPAADLD